MRCVSYMEQTWFQPINQHRNWVTTGWSSNWPAFTAQWIILFGFYWIICVSVVLFTPYYVLYVHFFVFIGALGVLGLNFLSTGNKLIIYTFSGMVKLCCILKNWWVGPRFMQNRTIKIKKIKKHEKLWKICPCRILDIWVILYTYKKFIL